MATLNRLPEEALRSSDRLFGWQLILFGYTIAMLMAVDTAGLDDPVFGIVKYVPYMPYSLAALLAVFTTVYAIGERANDDHKWRGRVIIVGCLLCGSWFLAMSLMMTRMVYVHPTRITDLWPMMMFFAATLFFGRIVVYANAFTGDRWNTNPYQLWFTMFLMLVSLGAVIIGVAPMSVFTEVERPAAIQIALANLLGASVIMFGLHLRNKEMGTNLELAGAISLVATLAWYCTSVLHKQLLSGTTIGFGLTEAFVFATLHRSIQILTLKWARRRNKPRLAGKMTRALHPEAALQKPDLVDDDGR